MYLSFGLEGVGPSAARQDALQRLLQWFDAPHVARGALVNVPTTQQMVAIGATASYSLWVTNLGQTPARLELTVDSPTWPAQIVHPVTGLPVSDTGELAPCASMELRLQVQTPRSAVLSDRAETTVSARLAGEVLASDRVYTSASDVWRPAADMAHTRYRHVAAAVGCHLVAIGGFVDEQVDAASNLVEVLDLAKGVWSPGANKPTPTANAGVAVLDGRVYVLGGYHPALAPQTLAAVEIYDVASDTWQTAPALPTPLSGIAATTFEGAHLCLWRPDRGRRQHCQLCVRSDDRRVDEPGAVAQRRRLLRERRGAGRVHLFGRRLALSHPTFAL